MFIFEGIHLLSASFRSFLRPEFDRYVAESCVEKNQSAGYGFCDAGRGRCELDDTAI